MSQSEKCPPWKRKKLAQPSDDDKKAASLRVPDYEVWKPDRLNPILAELTPDAKETHFLCKSLMGVLNKLTWENLENLSECIKSLHIDTPRKTHLVVDLIHKRAIAENKYRRLYVRMCDMLLKSEVNGENDVQSFTACLISKCEVFFSLYLSQIVSLGKEKKEIDSCSDKRAKKALKEAHEKKEKICRKKLVANCEFIGELFKLNLIHPAIIFDMINRLSKTTRNVSVECICTIITSIGLHYEEKIGKFPEMYFKEMELVLIATGTPAWVRFLIQELLDLRKRNWRPKDETDSIKTTHIAQKKRISESEKNQDKALVELANIPLEELISETETNQNPIQLEPFEHRVRIALDALTPDNIIIQITSIIPIDDVLQFEYFIDLIFKKVIREPDNCNLYAKLCNHMWNFIVPDENHESYRIEFKTIVLRKCLRILDELKADEVAQEFQKMHEENDDTIRQKAVSSFLFIIELFKLKILTPEVVFHLITKIIELKIEDLYKFIGVLIENRGEILLHLKTLDRVEELFEFFDKLHQLVEDKRYCSALHNQWNFTLRKFLYADYTESVINECIDENPMPSLKEFTPFMLFFYLKAILSRCVRDAIDAPKWIHLHEDEFSNHKYLHEAISLLITYVIGKPLHFCIKCGQMLIYFVKWSIIPRQDVIDGFTWFLNSTSSQNRPKNLQIILNVLFGSEFFKPDDLRMELPQMLDVQPTFKSEIHGDYARVPPIAGNFAQVRPVANNFTQVRPRAEHSVLARLMANNFAQVRPLRGNSLFQARPRANNFAQIRPRPYSFAEVRPTAEKVSRVPPIEENITQVRPTAEKVARVPPIEENITQVQPTAKNVAQDQPIKENIAQVQPVAENVAQDQPKAENAAEVSSMAENSIQARSITEDYSKEDKAKTKKLICDTLRNLTPDNFNPIEFESEIKKLSCKVEDLRFAASCLVELVISKPDLGEFHAKICSSILRLTVDEDREKDFCSVLMKTCGEYFDRFILSKYDPKVKGKPARENESSTWQETISEPSPDTPQPGRNHEDAAALKSVPITTTVTNSVLWRKGYYLLEIPGKSMAKMKKMYSSKVNLNCPKCNVTNEAADIEFKKIDKRVTYCKALIARLFATAPIHLIGRLAAAAKIVTPDPDDVTGDRCSVYMPEKIYNAMMDNVDFNVALSCSACGQKNEALATKWPKFKAVMAFVDELLACISAQVDFKLNEPPPFEKIKIKNQDGNKAICRFFCELVNMLNNEDTDNTVNSLMEKLLVTGEIELFCETYHHLNWKKERFENSLFEFKIPEFVLSNQSNSELTTELWEMLTKVAADFADR